MQNADHTGKSVDKEQVNDDYDIEILRDRESKKSEIQNEDTFVEDTPTIHHVSGHGKIIDERPRAIYYQGETEQQGHKEISVFLYKQQNNCTENHHESRKDRPDALYESHCFSSLCCPISFR